MVQVENFVSDDAKLLCPNQYPINEFKIKEMHKIPYVSRVSIKHIGTNFIISNPLTKGLPPMVFHEHTVHMGVMSFKDIWF
ncbi:hypothetical protein V6Z12_D12G076300 [Gossypium hirsutum]